MTIFTVAQVITAEAQGAAPQFAVAATIQNRLNANLAAQAAGQALPFGGGLTAEGIANAPGQFAGHLTGAGGPGNVPAVPSSDATLFGGAIDSNSLNQYGSTGNALYFQSNQGQASTVVGGNSANIGGNFFSDQFGQPSANFQAPSFSGPGAATPSGDSVTLDANQPATSNQDITGIPVAGVNAPADDGSGDAGEGVNANGGGNASDFDQFSGLGAGNATNTGGLSTPALQGGAGNTDASAGNPLGFGTSSATTPDGTFTTVTPTAPANTTPSSAAAFTGGGPPVEITNISDAGQVAGASVQAGLNTAGSDAQKGLNTAASAITSSESNAATTGTSWLDTILANFQGFGIDAAFVVLGLIILIGAFVFFYMERKNVVQLSVA